MNPCPNMHLHPIALPPISGLQKHNYTQILVPKIPKAVRLPFNPVYHRSAPGAVTVVKRKSNPLLINNWCVEQTPSVSIIPLNDVMLKQ